MQFGYSHLNILDQSINVSAFPKFKRRSPKRLQSWIKQNKVEGLLII